MTDIFISYKSEERALPEALANALRAEGYSVWWDTALVGGSSFRAQILERLDAARAAIVIWTPQSVKSDFVLDEASRAYRVKKLIPVRVPELKTSDIPLGFGQAQTYLLSELHRILEALAALGVTPNGNTIVPGRSQRIFEKRVALVIGCANYSVGSPLANPVRDARALAESFERLGFTKVTLAENPKLIDLGQELADFAELAEDADIAAIRFNVAQPPTY